MDLNEIESALEALIYVSDKPLSEKKLAEVFGEEVALEQIQAALENLKKRYQEPIHGVELAEVANGYQFRTKLLNAPWVKKLSKTQVQKLSRGAMETLTLVAYKQPILK